MITHYEEVGCSGQKSGICPYCKRRAIRSQSFTQTINPWNKNAAGEVKSRQEIHDETRAELFAWKEQPTYHAGCEDKIRRQKLEAEK